jgi:multidrug resistance efflux pump
MKKRWISPLPVALVILVAAVFLGWAMRSAEAPAPVATVTQEAFSVWSEYEGRLESEHMALVMSRFQGNATVVELAPEGLPVKDGDVLVRFDSSLLEREIHKLESEEVTARSAYESLKNATLPLEVRELEMKITEARTALNEETEYLEMSRPMSKEGLVSEQEIAKQTLKVDQARTQLQNLEWKLKLTKSYLHPAALDQAQAKVTAAQQELQFAREQIANCIIRATGDGNPVYRSLYIAGEYRTIRIGDVVYPNQPFMALPNMTELAVHIDVPEAELARVIEGRDATIRLVAFPEIRMNGFVSSVGSLAQAVPGQSAWQRYFHVIVRPKMPAADPRLRPGMTVTVQIQAYVNPRATLVPRTAVHWDGDRAWALTKKGSSIERRGLTLGRADDKSYEVLDGLKPGEIVIVS